MLEITEVRIYPVNGSKSNLLAFAAVTIEDALVITGVKVLEGKKGNFIGFPASKGSDEEYHDIVFPLSKDFREAIQDAVLQAYDEQAEEKPKKNTGRSRK